MIHPEELLSGYVDGSLNDEERVVVDAHVAGCDRCREELVLAERAAATLRALSQEPVPPEVLRPVAAELERMTRGSSRPQRARLRWGAGIAVAAGLALFAIVGLPRLGGGGRNEAVGGDASATLAAPEGVAKDAQLRYTPPTLERLRRSYDEGALRALLRDIPPAAREAFASARGSAASASGATRRALRCVRAGGRIRPTDVLVRLIDARFDGRTAYIAIFLRGRRTARPPSEAIGWVVAKDDCSRVLAFASTRI